MLVPLLIIGLLAVVNKAIKPTPRPNQTQAASTVNTNIGLPVNQYPSFVAMGGNNAQVPAALAINPKNTFLNPVAEDVTAGLVSGLFA
jgi:hypothetical protein